MSKEELLEKHKKVSVFLHQYEYEKIEEIEDVFAITDKKNIEKYDDPNKDGPQYALGVSI